MVVSANLPTFLFCIRACNFFAETISSICYAFWAPPPNNESLDFEILSSFLQFNQMMNDEREKKNWKIVENISAIVS